LLLSPVLSIVVNIATHPFCIGFHKVYAPEETRGNTLNSNQTQPVGFNRPAILQAPFAGPLGKSS